MEEKETNHGDGVALALRIGAARTLLDLALDYYEAVANLGGKDFSQSSVSECTNHLAYLKDWAKAIEDGTAFCFDDDDDEDDWPGAGGDCEYSDEYPNRCQRCGCYGGG